MYTKLSDFTKLCNDVAPLTGTIAKTARIRRVLNACADLKIWCKLLLPQCDTRVYNMKSCQFANMYAKMIKDQPEDLVKSSFFSSGDVSTTAARYHSLLVDVGINGSNTIDGTDTCNNTNNSDNADNADNADNSDNSNLNVNLNVNTNVNKNVNRNVNKNNSTLTLKEVDKFLDEMSTTSDRIETYKLFLPRCTSEDVQTIVRLLIKDLKVNIGPHCVLSAVSETVYTIFQLSKDLNLALDSICDNGQAMIEKSATISPMLAAQCRTIELPFRKFPKGLVCEVKYDGERIQIHRFNGSFSFYSRSLKPVACRKIEQLKVFITQVFPANVNIIVDGELLMIDKVTGELLPFGSLGVHKRNEYKNAQECIMLFDCMHYNGENLLERTLLERHRYLRDNVVQIPNRVMISKQLPVKTPEDLKREFEKSLALNQEGLMLKSIVSTYEPGKRRWLKMKRDYFNNGGDTADLVVLGGWYGTGRMSGKISVFLMGCLQDDATNSWIGVTKVHSGLSDQYIENVNFQMCTKMIRAKPDLKLTWSLVCRAGCKRPQFLAIDPKKQPVWEISCTEITNKLSFRFPHFIRERDDKDWTTANTLSYLEELQKKEHGANPPTKRIKLV